VKAGARLGLIVAVASLEQLLDGVPLVEGAVALREEVPQAVDPAPDLSPEEPGFEVLGEDLAHHLLGARVPLEDGQVPLKNGHQLVVCERAGHRGAG
jgi:hypothetical protein